MRATLSIATIGLLALSQPLVLGQEPSHVVPIATNTGNNNGNGNSGTNNGNGNSGNNNGNGNVGNNNGNGNAGSGMGNGNVGNNMGNGRGGGLAGPLPTQRTLSLRSLNGELAKLRGWYRWR